MNEPTTEAGRHYSAELATGHATLMPHIVDAKLAAIEAEARDEQAAQIGALREKITSWRTVTHGIQRHGRTSPLTGNSISTEAERDACEAGMCSEYNEALRLLASPAPAVEAYAARLRREGAEAALTVERIAAALRDCGLIEQYQERTVLANVTVHRDDRYTSEEWAEAIRAAILDAAPQSTGSEGES